MVTALERLRDAGEAPVTDLDLDRGIVEQVQRPLGAVAGRDKDGAIGFIDIADRHRSWESAVPASRREAGDLPLEEEVAADVVRQRARCQDLPSVWVDGA